MLLKTAENGSSLKKNFLGIACTKTTDPNTIRRKTKSGRLACEAVTIKPFMLIQIIQVDAHVDWVTPICQGKLYSD